jgi:hypothetical protein
LTSNSTRNSIMCSFESTEREHERLRTRSRSSISNRQSAMGSCCRIN